MQTKRQLGFESILFYLVSSTCLLHFAVRCINPLLLSLFLTFYVFGMNEGEVEFHAGLSPTGEEDLFMRPKRINSKGSVLLEGCRCVLVLTVLHACLILLLQFWLRRRKN